jgi:hypothetical protein
MYSVTALMMLSKKQFNLFFKDQFLVTPRYNLELFFAST